MGLTDRLREEERQAVQQAANEELAKKTSEAAGKEAASEELIIGTKDAIRVHSLHQDQNTLLISLLGEMSKLGFIDYIKGIEGRVGNMGSTIYRAIYYSDNPYRYDNGDSDYKESVELLDKSERDLEESMERTGLFRVKPEIPICFQTFSDRIHERIFYPERFSSADSQFFGDPVNKQPKKGFWSRLLGTMSPPEFTEPKEAGIGLRFSKLISSNESDYVRTRSDIDGESMSFLWHSRSEVYSAFYVRIGVPHFATITGASFQEIVNLSDISEVDRAMEKAYLKPFPNALVFYETYPVPPNHEREN